MRQSIRTRYCNWGIVASVGTNRRRLLPSTIVFVAKSIDNPAGRPHDSSTTRTSSWSHMAGSFSKAERKCCTWSLKRGLTLSDPSVSLSLSSCSALCWILADEFRVSLRSEMRSGADDELEMSVRSSASLEVGLVSCWSRRCRFFGGSRRYESSIRRSSLPGEYSKSFFREGPCRSYCFFV